MAPPLGVGTEGASLSRISISPAITISTMLMPSGTRMVVPRRSTLGMLPFSGSFIPGLSLFACQVVSIWSPVLAGSPSPKDVQHKRG